jgi:hypothetical protein
MSATVMKIVKFTLPKLKSDGSNWILFEDSIELETASHNLQSHLDGTRVMPVHPHPLVTAPTVDQKKEIEEYLVALEKWTAGEATIKKGFVEALPLMLYLVVHKETTMREVWDTVVKHHQQKAQLIIVELCCKLQNEKCEEKGDIRTHLAKLQQMREDLAMMGEVVTDDNFHSIILGSLPGSIDTFLTSITNQISLITYKVTVAVLIFLLLTLHVLTAFLLWGGRSVSHVTHDLSRRCLLMLLRTFWFLIFAISCTSYSRSFVSAIYSFLQFTSFP